MPQEQVLREDFGVVQNVRNRLALATQSAGEGNLGIFRQFFHQFILIAIVMFAVMTLFQLVTLPVEYDASRRAKEQLFRLGLVREDERAGVSQVLDAAALTYVAAAVSTLLTLLYFLLRSGLLGGGRRRD